MSGVGGDRIWTGLDGDDLTLKNPSEWSIGGVIGVAGEEASIDELSVRSVSLMKLLSKLAKSDSRLEPKENPEEADLFSDPMSGAL
jgi:hypothetical protein